MKITLDLPHLGSLDLIIKDIELANFVKRQFHEYIIKIEKLNKFIYKSDAEIHFNLSKNLETTKIGKLSKNIKFEENKFTLKKNNIFKEINFKKNQYLIYQNIGVRAKIKDLLVRDKYSKLHSKFYNLVLFPIFDLYALFEGIFLLHGSVLEYRGKNIVICGLDGVGKSSLSNIIVKNGGKVYSDNFVLCDGKIAIPFNMPIRLEKNNYTENSGEVLFETKDFYEVYTKNNYKENIKVDIYFLLYMGNNNFSNKLSIDIKDLLLISNGAPEILESNSSLVPFYYVNKLINRDNKINNNAEIYELGIKKGELERGLKEIENVIKIFCNK